MQHRYFLYRLTWNAERNKYNKQPCSLDGQHFPVSPTEHLVRRTSAEDALAKLPTGQYALGMWLTKDDGMFFIDLDDVVVNGYVPNNAGRMIQPFVDAGCYYETSSSGRGVHIIGKYTGSLPPHSNRRGPFEFYTHGRGVALNPTASIGTMEVDTTSILLPMLAEFFPAHVVTTSPVIGRRPEWRGPDDDDELIKRALAARGSVAAAFGSKLSFADLWNGNCELNSETDMALASHLAFWTGCDAERIERLMCKSKLVRPKWKEHRTYLRDTTIHRACATTQNVYQERAKLMPAESGKQRIRNGADLMAKEFAPTSWAINGILPCGVTLLSGDPKAGKSFLSLQFAFTISTGCSLWYGRPPEKQGRALYLALEDNDRRMQKRLNAVKFDRGQSHADLGQFEYATDWSRGAAGVDEIHTYLEANPDCRLVIIDTIAAWRDQDTARMSAYQADYQVGESLKSLAQKFPDVAVLLVHHNRKQSSDDATQKISGTNGLLGSVDGALILEKPTRGAKHSTLVVTGRDIDNPVDLALERTSTGFWSSPGKADEVARSQESQAVIGAIRSVGPMVSVTDIQAALEEAVKLGTLRTRLSRMVKRGEILRTVHGDYYLPSEVTTPKALPTPPKITLKPPPQV